MPDKQSKIVKPSTTQNVLKSSFYNFWFTLVSKIGGLIFTIIVARLLLPELFGIYSLALTIILTIVTFISVSLDATLIRYLAESLKRKSMKSEIEARSRMAFLFNFEVILSILIALALFFLSDILAIYIFHKPLLSLPLKLGSIYLFVNSIVGFWQGIFYVVQKINYNLISETIFQVLRIALVLVIFTFYKTADAVFIALNIAFFISFIFLYIASIKKYRFLIKGERKKLLKQEKKRMLSFFGWMIISSFSLLFFTYIDMLMLGMFLPAEFVGYYSVVVSLITAVAALLTFSFVLLPVFTQIEKGKLERGFQKVSKYISLIAIPASIGLAFIATPVIRVVYGISYVPLQYEIAIVAAAALLSLVVGETAFTTVLATLFQAKEKPKIPSIILVIATIANVVLNYVFIKIGLGFGPQYGLVGVALATFLTRYGNLIALSSLAKKKFKIQTKISYIIKPLIASIVMLGFLFICDYFFDLSILTGIGMIILAIALYIAIMWAIKGLNKEDFETMKLVR